MTVSQATKFLEDAFDILNQQYFENALYEIKLGAERLNRPIANVMATLLHEMVHFYCHINDIQDTSRGGAYHNKRFKEEAGPSD